MQVRGEAGRSEGRWAGRKKRRKEKRKERRKKRKAPLRMEPTSSLKLRLASFSSVVPSMPGVMCYVPAKLREK